MAVLREDLPADLSALVQIGAYEPGLLNQLPFISVSAEAEAGHRTGLGELVGLKRETVDGSPVDLGYTTGYAGEAVLTLSLWSLTRPQLDQVHAAVSDVAWVRRERTWEAPPGTQNRTVFLRCQLDRRFASTPTPLPPPPPHITVTGNNVNLRAAPTNSSTLIGQAARNDLFELLGRSQDGNWVQGCCFQGQAVWMAVNFVETSVPLTLIPVSEEGAAGPGGDVEPGVADLTSEGEPAEGGDVHPGTASIDPGTAILAAAAQPVTTVLRQDLRYVVYLEFTQEPLVAAGELIDEVRITRQIAAGDVILDTERTRLFADHVKVVDEFPD